MSTLTKGIAVAAIHILIVLSLGGKLLYDRAHRPRVWAKTAGYDPDLPIRGRYVALSLEVRTPESARAQNQKQYGVDWVDLAVESGQLVAHRSERDTGLYLNTWNRRVQASEDSSLLVPPILFFLPEHADFPRLKPGEVIWAEVTVPRKGPPRPIQLAVKKGTQWVPLTYR